MTGCKTRSDYSHSFVSDVVYMIRYLCSGMPFGGSYAAAEPYQLDMTVAELDSAIKKFLLEHPQYDVIMQEHWYYDTIHNEYEFMTGEFHSMNDNDLNDTFNGYYSYFFYLPDVQLTIMCVSPSLAKPAELWLAKISESPGYVLCLHDNQNVNVDLSRKANEAVKRKFEREVLGQLGAYRSEGYNPPYRVRARNRVRMVRRVFMVLPPLCLVSCGAGTRVAIYDSALGRGRARRRGSSRAPASQLTGKADRAAGRGRAATQAPSSRELARSA